MVGELRGGLRFGLGQGAAEVGQRLLLPLPTWLAARYLSSRWGSFRTRRIILARLLPSSASLTHILLWLMKKTA